MPDPNKVRGARRKRSQEQKGKTTPHLNSHLALCVGETQIFSIGLSCSRHDDSHPLIVAWLMVNPAPCTYTQQPPRLRVCSPSPLCGKALAGRPARIDWLLFEAWLGKHMAGAPQHTARPHPRAPRPVLVLSVVNMSELHVLSHFSRMFFIVLVVLTPPIQVTWSGLFNETH